MAGPSPSLPGPLGMGRKWVVWHWMTWSRRVTSTLRKLPGFSIGFGDSMELSEESNPVRLRNLKLLFFFYYSWFETWFAALSFQWTQMLYMMKHLFSYVYLYNVIHVLYKVNNRFKCIVTYQFSQKNRLKSCSTPFFRPGANRQRALPYLWRHWPGRRSGNPRRGRPWRDRSRGCSGTWHGSGAGSEQCISGDHATKTSHAPVRKWSGCVIVGKLSYSYLSYPHKMIFTISYPVHFLMINDHIVNSMVIYHISIGNMMINHIQPWKFAERICAENWDYPPFYGILSMACYGQFIGEHSGRLLYFLPPKVSYDQLEGNGFGKLF